MSDRKTELELKRQKLAELRRAREERKQSKEVKIIYLIFKPAFTKDTLKEVDNLVASIVGTTPSPAKDEKEDEIKEDKEVKLEKEVKKRKVNLQICESVIFDMAPKPKIVYNKEIQTQEEIKSESSSDISDKEKPEANKVHDEPPLQEEPEAEIKETKKELTEEEINFTLKSNDFLEFFDKSSRMIEKALNEKVDFIRDYSIIQESETKSDLEKIHSFYCDRVLGRVVTDCSWSPKFGELCLASYDKGSNNDADGLVLVWNLHLPDRPEFTFESSSSVCSAIFSPFHPNYLVAGTYSGQILLYDTRHKTLPVLKSSNGHSHPVYSMKIVGTQNANNLVSCSTDGVMCGWQLDMMAKPLEKLELSVNRKIEEVAVSCMDFPENESSFLVGTEEGLILEGNRFDTAEGKAGIRTKEFNAFHSGVVTGINFHPSFGPLDFSQYCLTSSVDWSVGLWKRVVSKKTNTQNSIVPVMKFEGFSDYVYDVKWSPKHPSVFGSCDGSGKLGLWNLNDNAEVSVASLELGSHALNKLAWDKDGSKIACGGTDGVLHVTKVTKAYTQPSTDDFINLQKVFNVHSSSLIDTAGK